MNLFDIGRGWFEFIKGTPSQKVLMAKRLDICDVCPHKEQLNVLTKTLVKTVNENGNLYLCGICHCPLAGKTSLPSAFCPIDAQGNDTRDAHGQMKNGAKPKWGPAGSESYY
jgi:hypothetical protein